MLDVLSKLAKYIIEQCRNEFLTKKEKNQIVQIPFHFAETIISQNERLTKKSSEQHFYNDTKSQ
jgi:hypothetical protein